MTILNDASKLSRPPIRWADRKSEKLLGMALLVQGYWLDWSIHVSEKNRFVYFDNPKVASGTIKWTMSKLEDPDFNQAAGPLHDRGFTPMLSPVGYSDGELEHILFSGEYFRFAFVRNPFHRLLSAYLNKIMKFSNQTGIDHLPPKKKEGHTREVAVSKNRRLGILKSLGRVNDDWTAPISFAEFVRATELIDQKVCNPHWRLQTINLPIKTVHIDFIGRLEYFSRDMNRVLSKLNHSDFDMEQTTDLRYATHAKTKIEDMYDNELMDAVGKIYREDFDTFGYPSDRI